jgi:SPOR domain
MPLPVYSIDRFAGATWALKSQPLYDGGTQARDGRWLLSFGVFDRAGALALYDQLRADGYPVKIRPLREDGKSRYEVRLAGIATEREAVSLAARLAEQTGLAPAEVSGAQR